MPPKSSRDFQKSAAQRLLAAEALLRAKLSLDAQYIGGYTIKCSLKALILELTGAFERTETLRNLSSGAKMHRPDILLGELRRLGAPPLPLELARRLRPGRFDWTTDLRYETGRRDTGETTAFLRTAKSIHDWVEGQLP